MSVGSWWLPAVEFNQVTNLQYALSTTAQAYATVVGMLLTVGLAFTQLGEYRIPIRLLIHLSMSEALALMVAAAGVILPVAALGLGRLELYRLCLLLFVLGVAALPVFAVRMIRRTRPAFYVRRLLKSRNGWNNFAGSVLQLAVQAADKRDWMTLEMMVALLGQLSRPDTGHALERGWAYQVHLPGLVRHLVETDNDRGIRSVLRTISYGAVIVPRSAILDMDETRGWVGNALSSAWLRRPAWVHRVQARRKSKAALFTVPSSYDYGILMHLTTLLIDLTRLDETRPGEPFLPRRVSGFYEWVRLLTTVVYSTYLLDEACRDGSATPGATPALVQMSEWEALMGTVEPKALRDAVQSTPQFGRGLMLYPLHYPKDLQENARRRDELRGPAQVRAANRLSRRAAEVAAKIAPEKSTPLFWPEWSIVDGKVMATGCRFRDSALTQTSG